MTELKVTVAELKEMAKALQLKGYSNLNKKELIEMISNATANTTTNATAVDVDVKEPVKATVLDTTAEKRKEVKEMKHTIETRKSAAKAIRVKQIKQANVLFATNSNTEETINIVLSFLYAKDKDVVAGTVEINSKHSVNMFTIEKLSKLGANEELISAAYKRAELKSISPKAKFERTMLKKWSKKLGQCAIYQIELSKPFSFKSKEQGKFYASTNVIVAQESPLLRFCDNKQMKFSDSTISKVMNGTTDIVYMKLSDLVGDAMSPAMIRVAFDRLVSTKGEGIYLNIQKNGEANVSWYEPSQHRTESSKFYMPIGSETIKYELLNISPSGYRSGSIVLGAVKKYTRDANGVISNDGGACDKREWLVDVANDCSISKSFKEVDKFGHSTWKKMTELKAFKSAVRIANCNAPSKVSFKVKNAVVLDNIAEFACYDANTPNVSAYEREDVKLAIEAIVKAKAQGNNEEIKNATNALSELPGIIMCNDTKDGNVFASAESQCEFLNDQGEFISLSAVLGTCFQTRGIGSLKSSMTFVKRLQLANLTKFLVELGCTVNYAIFNGKRVSWTQLTAMEQSSLLSSIDVLADRNAIKLDEHDDNVNVTMLKMAYDCETKFSQILNIAMAVADMDETVNLLERRFINYVKDAFKQVGINFELDENGNIGNASFDPISIQRISNDPQLMEHLLSSDPEMVIAAFPYALRHVMENNIETICKRITNLDIPVDATYTVVQADPAVLFGFRALNDNEFFCSDENNKAEESVAIRQPMSGDSAVTYFKRVTLSTIMGRVSASSTTTEAQEFVFAYYKNSTGYNTICASHYLMEKHDGMDWDIDAMIFYYDTEIIDICKKMPEFGTKINRSYVDYTITEQEKIITAWKDSNGEEVLRRPGKEFKTGSKEVISKSSRPVSTKTRVSGTTVTEKTTTVAFNNVARLAEKIFENPIADVGTITSGFYNNVLIKLCLIQGIEVESICAKLKEYYGCNGTGVRYVSPINQTISKEGYVQYELNKDVVVEAMIRFSESEGSVEDCLTYIIDCCIINRYPAESSIDAAKQDYKILDYVNHRDIIRCLGMDKHLAFVPVNYKTDVTVSVLGGQYSGIDEAYLSDFNTELFEESCAKLGATPTRFMNLSMVAGIEKITKKDKQILAVIDPIANLKYDLCDIVNQIIILAEDKVREYVLSDKAMEIRAEIKSTFREKMDLKEDQDETAIFTSDVDRIIKNIKNAYYALTKTTKQDDIKRMIKEDVYEETTVKDFLTNQGIAGIRNFAKMSFANMSSADIGVLIAAYYVIDLEEAIANDEPISTINPGLCKVMEEEFITGLSALGFENVDFIGEKVASIVNMTDEKFGKVKTIDGEFIEVVGGCAVTEINGVEYEVRMDSKKANIEGFVDGGYVIAERTMNVDESNDMILSGYNAASIMESDMNSFLNRVEGYTFAPKEGKLSNVLFGTIGETEEYICQLSLSDYAKRYIDTASELGLLNSANVSILVKVSEERYYTSVVLHDIMDHDAEIRQQMADNKKSKKETKQHQAPANAPTAEEIRAKAGQIIGGRTQSTKAVPQQPQSATTVNVAASTKTTTNEIVRGTAPIRYNA